MKIGLIFPNKDRRYKTIHLGLAYLAAYAREHHNDLHFEILDTRVANKSEIKKFFRINFDLIGNTVFSPVYFEVKKIFNKIKQSDHKIPVCLGGPYVTTIMEDIFKETPVDYAVYGEGEITFSQLISHLKGEHELSDIYGLMYKCSNGNIIVNPVREKIIDLDILPRPAYDIFPMKRYPLHRMVTSRGCPFSSEASPQASLWAFRSNFRHLSAARTARVYRPCIASGRRILHARDGSGC